MKNVKQVNAENLQKAWDEGCSNVKKVLENLYPDFFETGEIYKGGDQLKVNGNNYLLAYISEGNGGRDKCSLIRIDNGCQYRSTFEVEDIIYIPHGILAKYIGRSFEKL